MHPIPLPTKGRHGKRAFTPEGERQIYAAVKVFGIPPIAVAAQVGASLVTVYAVVNRVEKELARPTPPSPTPEGGAA